MLTGYRSTVFSFLSLADFNQCCRLARALVKAERPIFENVRSLVSVSELNDFEMLIEKNCIRFFFYSINCFRCEVIWLRLWYVKSFIRNLLETGLNQLIRERLMGSSSCNNILINHCHNKVMHCSHISPISSYMIISQLINYVNELG